MTAITRDRILRIVLGFVLIWAIGCGSSPAAIAYGEENCAYCRMTVSDTRFGAQHVSRTGKVRSFDSIECLAGYHLTTRKDGEPRSLLVTDMEHPGTLLPAQEARFVRVEGVHTPMGLGIIALGTGLTDQQVREKYRGSLLTWDEVLALVEARPTPAPTRHDAQLDHLEVSHAHAQ